MYTHAPVISELDVINVSVFSLVFLSFFLLLVLCVCCDHLRHAETLSRSLVRCSDVGEKTFLSLPSACLHNAGNFPHNDGIVLSRSRNQLCVLNQ